jgi:hypothetical protein
LPPARLSEHPFTLTIPSPAHRPHIERLDPVKFTRIAVTTLFLAAALAGCATATPATTTAPSGSASAPAAVGCTDSDVTVVVDFGSAGAASATLKQAGLTTEGTADYGDQVVCRVNDEPSKADESCATLPSAAYWALWVKSAPDAEWEYAQEGVNTLQLAAGESVGLVYTEGSDSTPPQD